jgi:hypothetical protein
VLSNIYDIKVIFEDPFWRSALSLAELPSAIIISALKMFQLDNADEDLFGGLLSRCYSSTTLHNEVALPISGTYAL